jgi:hypothetical protein
MIFLHTLTKLVAFGRALRFKIGLLQHLEFISGECTVLYTRYLKNLVVQGISVEVLLLVERGRQARMDNIIRNKSGNSVDHELVRTMLLASELEFVTKFRNSRYSD